MRAAATIVEFDLQIMHATALARLGDPEALDEFKSYYAAANPAGAVIWLSVNGCRLEG